MLGVDDIEEVRVGEFIPYPVVFGFHPGVDVVVGELTGRVAFMVHDDGVLMLVLLLIVLVFDCAEHSKEVLFELHADELFTTRISVIFGSARVRLVPRVGHSLRQEVDPASIGC